jgi:NADH:ubiquinone oxidoreductase subunit 2 (subunit N)
MTKKNILFLIGGLGTSLLISGVIYWYLFLETIDLFGIDSIKNPEGRHGKILLIAILTSLLTLAIAVLLRRLKYASIGFAIPSLIGITLALLIGPTYISKSNYYEPFDQKQWLT